MSRLRMLTVHQTFSHRWVSPVPFPLPLDIVAVSTPFAISLLVIVVLVVIALVVMSMTMRMFIMVMLMLVILSRLSSLAQQLSKPLLGMAIESLLFPCVESQEISRIIIVPHHSP
jgi:hypothetical protein